MTDPEALPIFATTAPGLEPLLRAEASERGFDVVDAVPGGVTLRGGWPEVWRANLALRGASRVLVRLAAFRAPHLAQLDKRARRVEWGAVLRPDVPVRVEATCRKSRIYHAGAAAQRVARAVAERVGAPVAEDATIRLLVRIEDDLCQISVDASGAPLHRRGLKQAVGKAPMRETLAALFLRACGYSGAEPVSDPMCGSGTFVIEAAEIACGLPPGRARAFAFEALASHDPDAWRALREDAPIWETELRFHGADRDAGAIAASRANAERAGVGRLAAFAQAAVSDFAPPAGQRSGLVMVNPPYGSRIGDKGALRALYGALGATLRGRFSGWRVGLVTSEPALAAATGLAFEEIGPPIPHGPLKIRLHRTAALP